MSVVNSVPLIAAGDDGYQISRSVRLRSSASAYFNRTPASAGNRKTWTWSAWVKRGALGSTTAMFMGGAGLTDTGGFGIAFGSDDKIYLQGYTTNFLVTTQVFRDVSAWYHFVVVMDSPNATANNRLRIYVNGSEVTAFSTRNNLTQNTDYGINQAASHTIAYQSAAFGYAYFDGYMTDVNFIDGQALTPSDFGETDTTTGVWKPKKYAGTYGTNGFYLNFSDNSNNTAATIGKDYSGNGNNWTPNNISVTSGATYDSMLDVPTPYADGGNGRGNYAVMNPLDYVAAAFSGTASNGNLTVSIPAPTNSNGIASSIRVVSTAQPKFYIESTITSLSTACSFGMISGTNANYRLRHTADITLAVNDVVMTAFDPATGNIWYGRNGTWLSSGNPSAGTNPFYTIPSTEIVGSAYCVLASNGSTGTFTTSTTFGQQPFTYTPPTGFKALNTQNLPDSTIKKGNLWFDATTYTGNGGSLTVSNGNFQPDLIWAKPRSAANWHALWDSARGANNLLYSNATNADDAVTNLNMSVNSTGWSMNGANSSFNPSGATVVGWQWKESASAGFDIVTYTGTGSARTVSHSLGVAPSMMIVKNRTTSIAGAWTVYHSAMASPASSYLFLELADSRGTVATPWNGTAPTSSVFSVDGSNRVNQSGNSFVAYLFAEVAGFSRFGSYTGNGSTDGPFVFCGFRPRFILTKNITTGGYWWEMVDSAREPINPSDQTLYANVSDAEYTSSAYNKDLLSNGFKIRGTNAGHNASGDVYIYAAFAENPFKNSLAR